MSAPNVDESNKLYIHLQNLPWSAMHQDVRQFFIGISIPPGGISIYCTDAFVVVTNKNDVEKALAMNGKDIHGTKIHLESSSKRDAFRRKCDYISRKLQFSPSFRRIRPTIVPEKSEDKFNVFNPKETEVNDENKRAFLKKPNKEKSKKIRPTLVRDLTQLQVFDESDNDSGGHCIKKMRLSENWLVSHLEVV